jgi:hypothetical protein
VAPRRAVQRWLSPHLTLLARVGAAVVFVASVGARPVLADGTDPVYQTVNGQESLSSMTDQLRTAGYGGPWDQDSVVAAYAETTGGPVTPIVGQSTQASSTSAAGAGQASASGECAGYNEQLVYLTWDRTGSPGSATCTPWSGYTLMDPAWVDDHQTFGLGTQAKTGESVAWACGVVIGATRAADAPLGVNIYVRGASAMSSPWNDWLIPRYGAAPCASLQATFGNRPPDVNYRQAWPSR